MKDNPTILTLLLFIFHFPHGLINLLFLLKSSCLIKCMHFPFLHIFHQIMKLYGFLAPFEQTNAAIAQ